MVMFKAIYTESSANCRTALDALWLVRFHGRHL